MLPDGARRVRERLATDPRRLVVPEWEDELPWVVHGTTTAEAGDFGLYGEVPVGESMARWLQLLEGLGLPRAVHARQVHGRVVVRHGPGPGGLHLTPKADGHATGEPGTMLTVSVADCVPVSLVDPARRWVALLHAGWRGTAAGVLAAGLRALDADAGSLIVHLGPAICGSCYEVGPEVHEALGLPRPDGATPVDLRAVQARRLVEAGVLASRITVSQHCTACGTGLFSHRAGSRGRQLGLLGVR